jgi:transcriptional regulator with XRE-family HTH domain
VGQGSPEVGRRQLAMDLRRLRASSGRTIDDVARHLECSAAKVSRMETGAVRVGLTDLRAVLELYGVIGAERDALFALARQSRIRGWWHDFADVVPLGSETFYGLEDGAATIGQHSTSLVPGLLQTADYARALVSSVPGVAAAVRQRRVDLRLRRQQLLDRPQPPALRMVLDEAVLHREIGGPAVLAGQLEHLLAVAQRPYLQLQVLPFTAGAHPAAGVSFTLFGFAEPGETPVAFREQLDANSFLDRPEQVAVYSDALADACRVAADPVRSRELLAARLAELPVSKAASASAQRVRPVSVPCGPPADSEGGP